MAINGGLIGTDNDPTTAVKITSFTSSGTFVADSPEAEILIVAGGAGGSGCPNAGSQCGGGGGYGDPNDREASKVLDDYKQGYISKEYIEKFHPNVKIS